jgi:hypothetical protein
VDTLRALETLNLIESAGYGRVLASHMLPEEGYRRSLRLLQQRILQVTGDRESPWEDMYEVWL